MDDVEKQAQERGWHHGYKGRGHRGKLFGYTGHLLMAYDRGYSLGCRSKPMIHDEQCVKRQMEVEKHNEELAAKYPDLCNDCRGWGGKLCSQAHPYGSTVAHETLFDPCETCEGKCSRCGKEGLDEEGSGPCKECGWDYDDGLWDHECTCYHREESWKD